MKQSINVFLHDSTFDYDCEIAVVFIGTSDSIWAIIINIMHQLLYDSFGPMLAQVKQNLQELSNRKAAIIEEKDPEVVYGNSFK